jgi:hypothetical protein
MLSKLQLNSMLSLQDSMNKKINPEWIGAGYGYLRAAMHELIEMQEHIGWKWWKKQVKDLPQAQMELVDVWHFALSDIIIYFNGDIEKASVAICQELASNSDAIAFDGYNYNFKDQSLLDNIELLSGLCAARRFDVPLFFFIASQAEMNTGDLYQQYVGKNILNFFRQDNGYKDGTYIKVWDGKEDNEHLVTILNSLDINAENYSDQVYKELEKIYPE